MQTYLEDLKVGDTMALGSHRVTEDEIVRFGREFDPQPFHTDPEAAKASPFGGLVASGWHTASIAMRLLVEGLVDRVKSYGSPGVDELRWRVPVRPGDELRLIITVAETRPSASKPDRGTVVFDEKLYNQRNEVVMTKRSLGIVGRRPQSNVVPSAE